MALVLTPLNGLLPSHMLRVVDGGRGPRGPQRLRLDAADAYDRCLRAGMPSGCLRSGYRTRAEQQAEVDRARAGKTPVAAAPGRSYHGEGTAADVDEPARSWLHRHGAAYGWRGGLIASEPWHFVYDPEWNRHASDPAPAPEEETMKIIKGVERPECYVWGGAHKWHIADERMLHELLRVCGQAEPLVLGQFTVDRIPTAVSAETVAAAVVARLGATAGGTLDPDALRDVVRDAVRAVLGDARAETRLVLP